MNNPLGSPVKQVQGKRASRKEQLLSMWGKFVLSYDEQDYMRHGGKMCSV